jgi:hypothetical protein
VHFALVARSIGYFVLLLHGQGIHISPQGNGWARLAAFNDRHNAGFGDARFVINAPLSQAIAHKSGRQGLLKSQLWVLMKLSPPRHQLRQQISHI